MKIAITGHTSGIGKALFDVLNTEHEVFGFSRSNGYDISVMQNINKIISQCSDADVFINNAYHNHTLAQVDIFEKLLTLWNANSNKTIININTKAIYSEPNNKDAYVKFKKVLKSAAVQAIRDNNRKCRIINVNPGYVKTARTFNAEDNQYYGMIKDVPTPMNMLEADKIAEIVKWCLEQPQGIEIGEISVWASPGLKD